MSTGSLIAVLIVTTLIAGITGALAGRWTLKRTIGSRFGILEEALQTSPHTRPATVATGQDVAGPDDDRKVKRKFRREPPPASAQQPAATRWPARRPWRAISLLRNRRLRQWNRPAPVGAAPGLQIEDPFGTRVVTAGTRPERPSAPTPSRAFGRGARKELTADRNSRSAAALQPAPSTYGTLALRSASRADTAVAATLVIQPGNGERSVRKLTGERSSWRVSADPGADIILVEASVDVLIGRNRGVWTASSGGPISDAVTLDGVTLPTVPMPWPPRGNLRVGAITMTLGGIDEPLATLEDPSNRTHAKLAGYYAAHANKYALALARSGKERAESVTAAALACFDSRLLDPARGAALAAMNMTLARRTHDEAPALADRPAQLFVGIAGFDRTRRLRAAANFPMAVWAITDIGSVQLDRVDAADGPDPVEMVMSISIDDDALRDADRPLLLIAAGPDLSVVGRRIRNLSTLNATAEQLTTAVLGPDDTNAPIAAAAAARIL